MSIESYKRRIEAKRKEIDSLKGKILDVKFDIVNLREKKRRAADRYKIRIKNASSTVNRKSIRLQKSREWEKFKKKNEDLKETINKYRDKIKSLREDIKRLRESIKRLR